MTELKMILIMSIFLNVCLGIIAGSESDGKHRLKKEINAFCEWKGTDCASPGKELNPLCRECWKK